MYLFSGIKTDHEITPATGRRLVEFVPYVELILEVYFV